MYCIKCGKETKTTEFLCEQCGKRSGFREKEPDDIEIRRKIGLYVLILGSIAILIGLLSSIILIKPDAPEDYVAQIFYETTTGPVEIPEDEQTDSTQETDSTQNVEEIKGYSYSIASYLMKKQVPKDATEDRMILEKAAEFVQEEKLAPVDLSDDNTRKLIESNVRYDNVLEVLDSYSGVNGQGVFVIIICVLSIGTAIYLAAKKDFGWSMLFALIATCPIWMLIIKLNGITSWEFESGIYFFVAGIFMALAAGIVGGNMDKCPCCDTILPGGASFCYKCGADFASLRKEKKEKTGKTDADDELKEKLEKQLKDD